MIVWHTLWVMSAFADPGVFAAVGDPGASRVVVAIILALVLIGLALAVLAVWLWRVTRVDHPSLAVLEVMGERRFRTADAATRNQLLDGARGAAAVESGSMGQVPSDHG